MNARSPSTHRPTRPIRHLVVGAILLMALLVGTVACRDDTDPAELAARARQMRDVSRMLDTMEAMPEQAESPPLEGAWPNVVASTKPAHVPHERFPYGQGWLAAIAGAIVGAAGVLVARRRRVAVPAMKAPSIADFFAERAAEVVPSMAENPDDLAPPVDLPEQRPAPTWIYQLSAYETPDLYLEPEPVDLLVFIDPRDERTDPGMPPGPADDPTPEHPDDQPPTANERSLPSGLYLIGDERFPRLRRSGDTPDALDAWERELRNDRVPRLPGSPDTRWLLCDLLLLRSLDRRKRDAAPLLHEAGSLAQAGAHAASATDRSPWIAQSIHIALARIGRQSGATRLFALRDLHERHAADLADADPVILDAWIDVQLAWSSWLLGSGADTHLAHAERLCDRLAAFDENAAIDACRRRADICLRRADHAPPPQRIALLDQAQSLLEDACARSDDASTSLTLARTAHARALLLPQEEAADACSVALVHAFLAEQHPTWHLDALACRLAIQLTYEGLPGVEAQGDIASTLRRELTALAPDSPDACVAMATMRWREGDHADASELCAAAWRQQGTNASVLPLWRDICRDWGEHLDHSGGDRTGLNQALHQLALARSTLRTTPGNP